jgi:hypothetical protein
MFVTIAVDDSASASEIPAPLQSIKMRHPTNISTVGAYQLHRTHTKIFAFSKTYWVLVQDQLKKSIMTTQILQNAYILAFLTYQSKNKGPIIIPQTNSLEWNLSLIFLQLVHKLQMLLGR